MAVSALMRAIAADVAKTLRTISTPPEVDLKVGSTDLKIQLRTDLQEAADHHDLRHSKCTVRRALREDRTRIQCIVDVEIHRGAPLAESEDLADAQVELVHPISVQSACRRGRWCGPQ